MNDQKKKENKLEMRIRREKNESILGNPRKGGRESESMQ